MTGPNAAGPGRSAGPPADAARGIPLGREWQLWGLGLLRSAGLPAARVAALAGDGAQAPADDGFPTAAQRSRAAAQFAVDPWFQEALTWQNRPLIQTWLADYAARLEQRDEALHRRGYREGIIARYVQRYSMKNETIGFFGPLAWAWYAPQQAGALELGPDEGGARREVFFAAWAVELLARRWEQSPGIRKLLKPRRDPSGVLAGTTFRRPRRPELALSADEAAVLGACDGESDAAGLLERARTAAGPGTALRGVDDVLAVLTALHERGCVLWEFDLPLDERMDDRLRRQLTAMDSADARSALSRLTRLTDHRDRVHDAAGDPPKLLAALEELDRCFEEVSEASAARTKEQAQYGRNPVWEDTSSAREVTLGPGLFAPAAEALSLILDSCRWLCRRFAERIHDAALTTVLAAPSRGMPFARLLLALSGELDLTPGPALTAVIAEFQGKMAELTGLTEAESRLRLSSAELGDRWRAQFRCPEPGWAAARLHSPDLMLAAADAAAVNRGEFQWVLGEVHVAVNTLENRMCSVFEPVPGWLAERSAETFTTDRYLPAFARSWPYLVQRAYPPLSLDLPDRHRYWSIESRDVLPAAVPRIPTADLVVVERDGRLEVTDRQAPAFRVPFIEFSGELLSFALGNAFKPVPARPHVPRITLDRLVIQRESWALTAGELTPGSSARPGAAELARALQRRGVCRHTFVRIPGERKPVFCDLRSDLLLNNIARLARKAEPSARLRFQELLPGFDELWFTDGQGLGRTSEFRFAAVDGAPAGVGGAEGGRSR